MAQTVISLTSFKGGVGKSTLAVNLAGALALNAPTTLIDEDPLQSCHQWAHRNGRLPMPVVTPRELEGTDLSASRYLLVDRKSTRLNSSHANISYAVFCLKKKK